eukprot:CAMPEP_0117695462 /NCGR_PEP_ID=MMETSP0804-20121206/28152_1 /TAXON_ID=1074897 /ORGANISM="Tetraselmis astigmatica, Strain CCMP880" /LENGTH=113 /DNA_ID=CAMNT_0005509535 /DNA_START=111 /DNA_END=452 /DNA_ORIENTATION=+
MVGMASKAASNMSCRQEHCAPAPASTVAIVTLMRVIETAISSPMPAITPHHLSAMVELSPESACCLRPPTAMFTNSGTSPIHIASIGRMKTPAWMLESGAPRDVSQLYASWLL